MTTKTAVGREVVSLDSLAKQRRDALPEPTTFELHQVEFTLPPMMALPFELQEKVDGDLGNVSGVLQEILGADKLREMYAAGYTFGDIELIAMEWQKRSGLEPGESAASTGS
ncbi:hypothetical protein EAO71_37145 [Streptomyces sp. ms191]|uniref:hypothetical protein n=1 Tax=Streptomyces sp. ms191 TaxID=1827978 RepID=UPI0011CE150E|nr:hypothetical protein [Streptomyces sp. ms191]TXS08229.1 hypothetical protein EAO71_37145 [Streptomyces sp. ms191]